MLAETVRREEPALFVSVVPRSDFVRVLMLRTIPFSAPVRLVLKV